MVSRMLLQELLYRIPVTGGLTSQWKVDLYLFTCLDDHQCLYFYYIAVNHFRCLAGLSSICLYHLCCLAGLSYHTTSGGQVDIIWDAQCPDQNHTFFGQIEISAICLNISLTIYPSHQNFMKIQPFCKNCWYLVLPKIWLKPFRCDFTKNYEYTFAKVAKLIPVSAPDYT